MQIANEGGFSEAIGLASCRREDGIIVAVQEYSEKSRETHDIKGGNGGEVVVVVELIVEGRQCRRIRRRGRRHGNVGSYRIVIASDFRL